MHKHKFNNFPNDKLIYNIYTLDQRDYFSCLKCGECFHSCCNALTLKFIEKNGLNRVYHYNNLSVIYDKIIDFIIDGEINCKLSDDEYIIKNIIE